MVISENGKVISRLIQSELANFSFGQSILKLPPPVRCLATARQNNLHLRSRAIGVASQIALIKGMFKYLTLYPEISIHPIALSIQPFPLLVEKVSESISMEGIIDIAYIDGPIMMESMKAAIAVSLPRILGTVFIADTGDAAAIRRSMMKEFLSNIVSVLNLPPNKVHASDLEGSQYISYLGMAVFTPPGGFGNIESFADEANLLMDTTLRNLGTNDPSQMFAATWDVIGSAIAEIIKTNKLIGAIGGLNFTRGLPAVIVGVTRDNMVVKDETIAKLSFILDIEVLGNVFKFFKRIPLPDISGLKIKLKRKFRDRFIDWDLEFDIASLIGKIEASLGKIQTLVTNIAERIAEIIAKISRVINDVINKMIDRIRNIMEALGAAAEYITEVIAELMAFPAKIIKVITEFITNLIAKLIQKAIATLKLITLRLTLKITWDSTKKIAGPVGIIATALYLAGEIEKMVARVAAFIGELIKTIADIIEGLKTFCGEIIEHIKGILDNISQLLNKLINIECHNIDCELYASLCDHRILSWIGVKDSIKPTVPPFPSVPPKPDSPESPVMVNYTRLKVDANGNPIVVKIPANDENWAKMQQNDPSSTEYRDAQVALESSLDDPGLAVPFDFADDDELKPLADALPMPD